MSTWLKAAIAMIIIGSVVTVSSVAQAQPANLFSDTPNPSGKVRSDGLPFSNVNGEKSSNATLNSTPSFDPECPATLRCVVIPAPYTNNNGVEDYGNYDIANRPYDMKINSIVIHDTEGSLEATLEHLKKPTTYASVQYVIDKDGTVYQMVQNKNVGWHAGNWWYNMHSIGIEHIGYAADSGSYTPAMYQASAKLVKYLTDRYNIPRDRGHIIGHDNVAARRTESVANMHADPGPFWNWQYYMTLLGAPSIPSGRIDSKFVTIAPVWPLSKQPVTGCFTEGVPLSCVPAGLQSTNFVYIRTEPKTTAPLIADPITGQGTTHINNNAARAFYGQTFAVADRKIDRDGIWYKIWVNGVTGWTYSPWKAPTVFPTSARTYITPKADKASIPVYGRPSPEAAAYPAGLLDTYPASSWIPSQAPLTPLAYQISSGQRYPIVSSDIPNDHFYTWASDSSYPYDHTVFSGQTKYIQISLGSRQGFVKAADVDIR
jgi:hypothetical protein